MDGFFAGIAIIMTVLLAAVLVLSIEINDRIKAEAIERGYALHCPDDGMFAWVGECDGKD